MWRPCAVSSFSMRLAMVDLPAPDRPVSHSTQACWPFWRARTCLSTSSACQCTFCERRSAKLMHPGTDGAVAQAVDEDEAAEGVVVGVALERDGPVELELAHADVIQLEALGGQLLEGVHVDLVLERGDGSGHRARAGLHQIGAALQHRLVVHPHDGRLELAGDLGRGLAGGDHIAAADVHLTGKGECHGLPGDGLLQVPVRGDDARHRALPAGGQHADRGRPC